MTRWILRTCLGLLAAPWGAERGLAAERLEIDLPHPGAILVADVTGEVTATFGEQRKSVKAEERLRVDATVTTGRRSEVKLLLSNAASIQLGAESEMEFEEFGQAPYSTSIKFTEMKEEPTLSKTRLRLARGNLAVEVKPLKASRGSSFTLETIAGTLQLTEGTVRAMVRMSDLGLGVCTVEIKSGEGQFEALGGKPEKVATGRKLAFAIEIEKGSGNVKLSDMPKEADVAPAEAAPTEAKKR